MLAVSVEFLIPFVLLVYGTIRVNDLVEPMAKVCYTLMSSPTHVPPPRSSNRTRRLAEVPNRADSRETFAEQTTVAMKLAVLVKEMPCTILLLGWKVSWKDVLATSAAVVVTQGLELELELIQTQMAQKPMLRAEVYAHAMRARQNRKKEVRREKEV